MATTVFPFTPSQTAPFQFRPTLDGQQYQATVLWNFAGQRWYLQIASLTGTLIAFVPVVGSLSAVQGSLTTTIGQNIATLGNQTGFVQPGWLIASGNVAAGATIWAMSGPVIYMTEPASLTGTDTGALFSFDLNLMGGYFFQTALVFRDALSQFEVYPLVPAA